MSTHVEDRTHAGEAPLRVLVTVQGRETAEWTMRAGRLVSGWRDASVRVLGLVDVTCPPFTSVIPPARRLYAAARAAWIDAEEQRVQQVVERVLNTWPRPIDVVRDRASASGRAETIAEYAAGWGADVIVVAEPPFVAPLVIREVGCAVLAIPASTPPRSRGRRLRLRWAVGSGRRWATAHPAE